LFAPGAIRSGLKVPGIPGEGGFMNRLRVLIVVIGLATVAGIGSRADEPDKQPAATPPRYEHRKEHDPYGTGKSYMGREVAPVMGHLGADWLERPEREKEEQPTKLLELLKVKPGTVIADIGAGSGYYTFRLAEHTGAKGKVLAVDIQPEMLAIIRKRM